MGTYKFSNCYHCCQLSPLLPLTHPLCSFSIQVPLRQLVSIRWARGDQKSNSRMTRLAYKASRTDSSHAQTIHTFLYTHLTYTVIPPHTTHTPLPHHTHQMSSVSMMSETSQEVSRLMGTQVINNLCYYTKSNLKLLSSM